MSDLKKYDHNPPHLFKSNCKYFITASTFEKISYLKSDSAKQVLFKYIKKSVLNFKWILEDWVILNNHYHLMLESPDNPENLGKIINNIHKYSAIWINKNILNTASKPIWFNYWDKCLTFERSYFTRLNYIWYNPVKHKYVDEPQNWKFGSFRERFNEDKKYLEKIRKDFPFGNLKIDDDF
jgi:putative transposase